MFPDTGSERRRGASAARDRLLAVTACFTAGALLVLQLRALPTLPWLLGAAVPALLPWRGRRYYALALLGALLAVWRTQGLLEQRWPIERYGEEAWVQGAIAALPDASVLPAREGEADGAPDRNLVWRFAFAPQEPGFPQRIRASWYRTDARLAGGECWRLRLRLKSPHGSSNPGGFDYEEWLFRQGIAATATVKDGEPCGDAPGYALLRLRQRLADRLRAWLSQHPAEGLVAALTIGDVTGLGPEDWDVFRLTGTTHLVAISGFNIAIVAGVAYFVLRWLWSAVPRLCLRLPAQKAALLGSALLGFGYALLAGFEPPVERAALMLLALVAAAAAGGLSRPSRALALAWLAIVGTDPLALLTPGLWLSFGAVAAIFYVSSGRLGRVPAWRAGIHLQLMLSLMLAPLTLFYFQGTSWLGPLVNLIAVPIVAVLTPLLLGALLLAWVWPAAGLPPLRWSADAVSWLRDGLGWIAQHAPQAWLPASPEPAALLLALLGAALLFAPRGLPLRSLGGLCFVPLLIPVQRAPGAGFELTALDVGQGLAVVVRTAQHALLFDAGPAFEEGFDAGRSIVAPYLLSQGIRRLDLMMISHGDLDHRGGAPAVRRLVEVREERGALAGEPCKAGQNWDWDGVRFEVLNGPGDIDTSAEPRKAHASNDSGCVLRVAAGAHAALLPADIERGTELRLVAQRPELLRAEVLLAPHHGSRTSSNAEFVEAVNPELVIFPAGYRNSFRHPRAEVVERYLALGSTLHMTGNEGAIGLRVDAERGVHDVRTWRSEAPRLWSAAVEPVPEDNR